MAKVRNNIFVRGLSGSVGDQFVVKQSRDGKTIISNSPTFNQNRTFSAAQLDQQDKFRDAVAYAEARNCCRSMRSVQRMRSEVPTIWRSRISSTRPR